MRDSSLLHEVLYGVIAGALVLGALVCLIDVVLVYFSNASGPRWSNSKRAKSRLAGGRGSFNSGKQQ